MSKKLTAEQKLKKIDKIFFHTKTNKKGMSITDNPYYNLMGARLDLERNTEYDAVCAETIQRVEKQLGKIATILKE